MNPEDIKVERDTEGFWWNPCFPWDDVPEEVDATPYLEQWGYEPRFIFMEDDATDEILDRYSDYNSADCSYWHPSKPEGDGWFLVAIYDTDDGPAACWVRECIDRRGQTRKEKGMKTSTIIIFAGIAALFGGSWLGAWLVEVMPTAYAFPAFMMGMLIMLAGGLACAVWFDLASRESET